MHWYKSIIGGVVSISDSPSKNQDRATGEDVKLWRASVCQILSSNIYNALRFNAHKILRKMWKLSSLQRWVRFNRTVIEQWSAEMCRGRPYKGAGELQIDQSDWTELFSSQVAGYNTLDRLWRGSIPSKEWPYLLHKEKSWKFSEQRVIRRSTWWKGYFRKITLAGGCR